MNLSTGHGIRTAFGRLEPVVQGWLFLNCFPHSQVKSCRTQSRRLSVDFLRLLSTLIHLAIQQTFSVEEGFFFVFFLFFSVERLHYQAIVSQNKIQRPAIISDTISPGLPLSLSPTWNLPLYSLQSCDNVISCHSPHTPSVSIFQSVNGFVFNADFWKSNKNIGKMGAQKSAFLSNFLGSS